MRGRPWKSLGAGVATLALSSCTLLTDLEGFTSEVADGGASGDAAPQDPTTPRLDLQFSADKSLVDRVAGTKVVSFERSSKATYTGLDGLVKTAASDEPRFDHDPSSKESLGLLLEESRTNLLLESASFFKQTVQRNASVVADATTAPDGTMTGDKLVESTVSASGAEMDATYLSTTAAVYTQSVFVKAAERYVALIGAYVANDLVFVGFNLKTGKSVAVPGKVLPRAYGIVPYGNGWYRIWATHPATGPGRRFDVGFLADELGSTFVGDGTSGMYFWGGQVEVGDAPSSYIPTEGAAVTRSADRATVGGASLGSLSGAAEGSLLAVFTRSTPAGSGRVASALTLADTLASSFISVGSTGAGVESEGVEVQSGNVQQAILDTGSLRGTGTVIKTAGAYKVTAGAGEFAAASDGAEVVQRTAGAFAPRFDLLVIGGRPPQASILNGHVRRVTCWSRRLTNDELRAATQ